jgi:TolA-binding protein
MKTSVFVTFCLGLTTVYAYFFGEAKELFHRPDFYLYEIEGLKNNLNQEKLRHLLTQYEFEDFRAHTASILPNAIIKKGPGEKSFPLRSLASVVQKSGSDEVGTIRAKELYERAKQSFRSKKYSNAISDMSELIRKHSYSPHINEAMFLIVESQFQLREYDSVVESVNRMLEIYPEDELTGYALLRLGKVYENKDRHDDAIEIYQTVLKVFPQRDLAALARSSLRSTEL